MNQSTKTSAFGRNFLSCCLLFGLVSCALILFIGMVFETNDDREFSSILAGSFGIENAAYTVFLNYVLSLFYKGLFLLLGTELNWYVAFSLIASCIALALIQAIVLESVPSPARWLCVLAVYLFVMHDQFLAFQFTKNAAFYTAAAGLGFTVALWGQVKSPVLSVVSGVLLVLGYLTRDKASILAIVFYITLNIGLLICSIKPGDVFSGGSSRPTLNNDYKVPIATLTIGLLTIIICTSINQLAYSSDDWREYLETNDINFSLLSAGELPDYGENKELYSSLGLDRNDYELYSDWSGGDSRVFSKEVVSTLASAETNLGKSTDVKELVDTLASEKGIELQLFTVVLAAVAALLITNRLGRIGVCAVLVLLCAEILYLLLSGSFSHRVFYSEIVGALFAALSLCLIPQIRSNGPATSRAIVNIKKEYILLIISAVAVVVSGMYAASNILSTDVRWKSDPSYSKLLEMVREDKSHFYAFDRTTTTYLAMNGKNPLRTTGVDDYSNMAYLGGWIALTPVNRSGLSERGMQSAYELLGRLKDSYIVDSRHAEMICQFVRRHYCAQAQLVCVGQIGSTYIYQLSGVE